MAHSKNSEKFLHTTSENFVVSQKSDTDFCGCYKCPEKAVIALQHGELCKKHFLSYFEEKVFTTIKKHDLLNRKDTICVAASGGKDSLTVLYLTKKFLKKNQFPSLLFALVVDEGIAGYREHTLRDLETFCKKQHIALKKVSFRKAFGATLDEANPKINKGTKKKPCAICGVWRRSLLNRHAREAGATKLVTGHNLDDEAQAILMNMFKANSGLAASLGPKSGIKEREGFVPRVKPLYFCTEKETRLYAFLKGFTVNFAECPNAREGFRMAIRDFLNEFEGQYKGTTQGIVNSFLEILPLLKEKARQDTALPQACERCGEPARQAVCQACALQEVLHAS
ncbi:TIGR00269 family protein [Candidatus Woesearchaeota archaeon]|nr:TIGR00269 family protein [Candidatus Woesearchaeota archaeon]